VHVGDDWRIQRKSCSEGRTYWWTVTLAFKKLFLSSFD
jgi:hypothetical protein